MARNPNRRREEIAPTVLIRLSGSSGLFSLSRYLVEPEQPDKPNKLEQRHASVLEVGDEVGPKFSAGDAHVAFDRHPTASPFQCGSLVHLFRR